MKAPAIRKLHSPTNNNFHINSEEAPLQKSSHSSLNKYERSPYLQSIRKTNFGVMNHSLNKKRNHEIEEKKQSDNKLDSKLALLKRSAQMKEKANHFRSLSNNSNYLLPKVGNMSSPPKHHVAAFRLPRIDQQQYTIDKQTVQSATLEFSPSKKQRLEPLRPIVFKAVMKTKAGTNGKQTKVNQDTAFIEQKFPYGLKCFCVCDGHGLNGHTVSAFIKTNMIKNLTSALKKQKSQPQYQKMQEIALNVFVKTNQSLLDSDINTELSGSTVVTVFIYKNKIFCLNVGDSRAILCQQVQSGVSLVNKEEPQQPQLQLNEQNKRSFNSKFFQSNNSLAKLHLSKSHKTEKYIWKLKELSIDQKPQRKDERERVLKNGGRIQHNKTEKGEDIGPLRVWMRDIQMPGLAMTRSFGDKAGLKAGTSSQAEVIDFDMTEQDKFIVVASDGVWEYLQSQQIMNLIVPYYLRDDIETAADKVVKLSTQIWGKISYSRDDISVIIVALNAGKK